jgi:hypothetical protein
LISNVGTSAPAAAHDDQTQNQRGKGQLQLEAFTCCLSLDRRWAWNFDVMLVISQNRARCWINQNEGELFGETTPSASFVNSGWCLANPGTKKLQVRCNHEAASNERKQAHNVLTSQGRPPQGSMDFSPHHLPNSRSEAFVSSLEIGLKDLIF